MLLEGVIMAINGATPGPASGISYKIAVDTQSGDVVLDSMVPWGARFPDELNTVAAPVGTPVAVSNRAGNYRQLPPGESIQIEVCEEPAP